MSKDTKDKSKEKFLKVYSNLPIPLREEIIFVSEKRGPITWNVTYLEVKSNTRLGQKILNKLEDLKVI